MCFIIDFKRLFFYVLNVYNSFIKKLQLVDDLVLPKWYNIDSEREKRKES